jgi:hypothetical protein
MRSDLIRGRRVAVSPRVRVTIWNEAANRIAAASATATSPTAFSSWSDRDRNHRVLLIMQTEKAAD